MPREIQRGAPAAEREDEALELAPGRPAREHDRTGRGVNVLNLTRLRYFVAVAQELHFGRAAKRLGISQPPLSLHIQALEHQIGAELFTRRNRRITLTMSGRILLDQAQQLLEHAQRVGHIMYGVGAGEIGELFVGCVPAAMYDVLPRIMTLYRERYPKVHPVLKEGHTLDAVADGRLDIGLVWRSTADQALASQTVLQEKFVALVPKEHPLSGRSVLSLDDLAREPLILPPRKISPYHYDHIISAFAQAGLSAHIEYEVPTILSQIGFVASGFGIAISPSFARRFVTDGVVLIDIAEEMRPVILSLVRRKDLVSRPVDQFCATITDLYGDGR